MWKRIILIASVAVLLEGASFVSSARAQCNPRREADEVALQIERAAEVVRRTDVREAAQLLVAARRRLREAEDLMGRRRTAQACANVRAAAGLARKAVEMASKSDLVARELERQLVRTDELLRDTAGLLRDCAGREVDRVLDTGRKQQEEAWRAFRSGRLRPALMLTQTAREQANRARRMCKGDLPGGTQAVERELQATDRFLEEARRILEERDEEDAARLSGAEDVQGEARRAFEGGRLRIAHRLTRTARAMARGAIGDVGTEVAPKEVQSLIASTGETVRRLRENAEEKGNDQAGRMLDRAARLLEEARTDLDAGKVKRAIVAARSASALAADVAEMLRESEE